MLSKSLRQIHSTLPKQSFFPLVNARSFCEWRPNVPKYQLILDLDSYHMVHPIWDKADINNIQITHYYPKTRSDRIALFLARRLKGFFDFASGYKPGAADEKHYLRRLICIEAISGVPGMIGGMIRHINSLSLMRRDHGWIHNLLQQAENERQHLFVFLNIKKPGILFRAGLFSAQALMILFYSGFYFSSWRTAHRFVGYLREESTKVYSSCIKDLDEGKLAKWDNLVVPEPALEYWGLDENASLRDVLACIRADEAMHREINHRLASLDPDDPIPQYEDLVSENFTRKTS